MPSIHENETRLVPLNGWQALDAVAIPGEALVEPVVAREIVEIVAASRRGENVEARRRSSAGRRRRINRRIETRSRSGAFEHGLPRVE